MSETYEINRFDEVVPYTSGRKCTDTRAWRDATELELQQRDEIAELQAEIKTLEEKVEELEDKTGESERAVQISKVFEKASEVYDK